MASSGLHSNGYSLVRKVVFDLAGLGVHDTVPELGSTVGGTGTGRQVEVGFFNLNNISRIEVSMSPP